MIDRYLPRFDVTEVHEVEVDAPPEVTYAAIREADLGDPLINVLFTIRELPNRLARKLRGDSPPTLPKSFTFADVARPEMGWVLLAENPGTEFRGRIGGPRLAAGVWWQDGRGRPGASDVGCFAHVREQ